MAVRTEMWIEAWLGSVVILEAWRVDIADPHRLRKSAAVAVTCKAIGAWIFLLAGVAPEQSISIGTTMQSGADIHHELFISL